MEYKQAKINPPWSYDPKSGVISFEMMLDRILPTHMAHRALGHIIRPLGYSKFMEQISTYPQAYSVLSMLRQLVKDQKGAVVVWHPLWLSLLSSDKLQVIHDGSLVMPKPVDFSLSTKHWSHEFLSIGDYETMHTDLLRSGVYK